MVVFVGLTTLLVGGAIACAANRVTSRTVRMETIGGALLLVGLVLLSTSLPFLP
jgi:hypothetical protein